MSLNAQINIHKVCALVTVKEQGPRKSDICANFVEKYNLYLTENTVRVHFKDQHGSTAQESNPHLLCEPYETRRLTLDG
jgi:hypothetical protein